MRTCLEKLFTSKFGSDERTAAQEFTECRLVGSAHGIPRLDVTVQGSANVTRLQSARLTAVRTASP